MRVSTTSPFAVSMAIAKPDGNTSSGTKYYNYVTTGWEKPFNPAQHTQNLTLLDSTTPFMSNTYYIDLPNELIAIKSAVGVMFAIDTSGNPTYTVDTCPLPYPFFGSLPSWGG